MGYKARRKILRVGKDTPAVALPKEWARFHELEYGDEVVLLGDAIIMVVPKHLERKAKKLLEKMDE